MTEEINYKEFANRFYNLLKVSPLSNMPLVKEYENAIKPKMTKLEGCENLFQVFAYKDRTYVLFYNNWYLLDGGQLHLGGGEELNEAYKMGYGTSQSKDAGEYQPTPQTPQEVEEGLRNAMIQAKKDGVFDEPKFPKRPTLYEIIADWWDEIFVNNNPSGQNIESLVDTIAEDWIPQKREKQFSDSYSNGFDDALDLMRKLLK